MKNILVFGGGGFIGGHVVDRAKERGLNPIIFDRKQTRTDVDFFLGDIKDFGAVNEAVKKSDYAINLSGILGTQETIRKPIPSVKTNTIGALNFAEAMVPDDFHSIQGVQIGVGNYWMNNSYSISKNAAVRFCQMYNKENGTKIAIVRAVNAYGPRQSVKPVRKITPTFIMRALRGEDIEIYGDGEQIMDMVYVTDLADILINAAIMDHDRYDEHVFEAGPGLNITVNQIASSIVRLTNSSSKIIHVPMRPGETKGAVVKADPKTLRPIKGYDFTPLEAGLKRTVDWYTEHQEDL